MAPIEEMTLIDLDRSNKGASKQRRDQINAEINILRDLLPLPESSRQRLSQLQVMSLSCVYIRKCNTLQKIFRSRSQEGNLPDSLDFFQAMTGFLLVTTREGKLIYISENVTDYLGHSMVDMKTQGDSLYDIIDKRDHSTVQAKLAAGAARDGHKVSDDISFFCRMNMSRTLKRQSGFGDVKVMHIQGHFVPLVNSETNCMGDQQSVFMASCSPLMTPDLKENLVLNNTMVFKTIHRLDMAFMEVTKMAEHHLGYTTEELSKTSWYNIIHPEDIHEAKEKHMQLVRSNHHEIGCMMTVRMIKADGSIFWVNIVMHVKQTLLSQSDEPYIVCINQIISAQEAYQIKAQGQMFSMYPGRVQELWGSHMSNISPNQGFNGNQWIQQEGSNSVPVPSYQCTMPNFPNQSGYPMMYPSGCSSMTDSERSRKPCRSNLQNGLRNLVQTDELKAMLKRKIQGPGSQIQSAQAKVPKMSWDVESRLDRSVYHESESPAYRLPDQYGKGEARCTLNPQGQVVQVMLATAPHPTRVYVNKQSYQSSPDTITSDMSSISHGVKTEQVVPDINVPESYLTPDPSPVSSPEPSSVVKSEVMDLDEAGTINGNSSVSILQALEKLASQPQDRLPARSPVSTVSPTEHSRTVCEKLKNRGLPIFDAFEIDNFFEMLDVPDHCSKASVQMGSIKVEKSAERELARGDLQISTIKKEIEMEFSSNTPQGNRNQFPQLTPMSQISVKTEVNETENLSCQSPNRKDLVVSSTMIQSPQSIGSQEAMTRCDSIDDFLSCFSDDGLVHSPFQSESSSTNLDPSSGKLTGHSPLETTKMSPVGSFHQMPTFQLSQGTVEEMSPQSTSSSCLSREDDFMDPWNFGMELDALDKKEELRNSPSPAIAVNEDLCMANVFDQVNFLLDSLVPSQESFEM